MVTFENVLPIITFLLGCFITNRLALGRDRRKDFKEVANPLFENLEKQRLHAKSGIFPMGANEANRETFIALIRNSPWHKKKSLERAIESYIQSKKIVETGKKAIIYSLSQRF